MTSGLYNWNDSIINEFRENNGTVTQNGFGRRLILVHHIGAKSGQERVSPVAAIRQDDDTWLIAASKAGAPDNPAWFHNLRANPDVQIETPDAMRGRVNSVNQLFIGTSNQLGEFESGASAAWLGPVAAAVIGGIGTLMVVVLWIKFFPALFNADRYEYDGR